MRPTRPTRWKRRSVGDSRSVWMRGTTMIKLKRAYELASKDDGLRILVERLWPRGVSKQRAQIDLWLKDLAPSTELRKWYGHDPARWPEFRKKYWAELKGQGDVLALLKYVTQ